MTENRQDQWKQVFCTTAENTDGIYEDFYKSHGSLSVIVGEGVLSEFELSILAPGDVICTTSKAGIPFKVVFNQHPIGHGEILVVEQTLGIRFTDFLKLEQDWTANKAEETELLPYQIRLATLPLCIDELKKIRIGSVINLDTPYSAEADAEIFVYGFCFAKGKVQVIDEDFGIRITQLLWKNKPCMNVRSTGGLLKKAIAPEAELSKEYDFTRPDRVTKKAILEIQSMHELFLQSFKAVIPEAKDYRIQYVDQLTFSEVGTSLYSDTYGYAIAQIHGNRNEEPREQSEQNLNEVIIQTAETKKRWSNEALTWIEKISQSRHVFQHLPMFVAFTKKTAASKFFTSESTSPILFACLRGGWRTIFDLKIDCTAVTDDVSKLKEFPQADMIVVAWIENKTDPQDHFCFVYPLLSIETVLNIIQ